MACGFAARACRTSACWLAALTLLGAGAAPARAQATADAGATSAGGQPAAGETAVAETAEAPPASGPDFPKTLSPQQRLPENLQGWLHERNRLHPVKVERAPPSLGPESPANEEAGRRKAAVAEYQRRLQSFDENGVTVLSNRHAAPPVVRVAARAPAPASPAPAARPAAPELEPEPERVETRSLRTNQLQARHSISEPGLGWSAFAAALAAIGLGWVWLRRRRAAD